MPRTASSRASESVIHDRDPLFTEKFQETLRVADVQCLKMPRGSPNLNSFRESWIWAASDI
jgi:hypothetical protein